MSLSLTLYAIGNKDVIGNWVEYDRQLKFGFDERDITLNGEKSIAEIFMFFNEDSTFNENKNLLGDTFILKKDSVIELFSAKGDLKSGGFKKYKIIFCSKDKLLVEQYYQTSGKEIIYQYYLKRYEQKISSVYGFYVGNNSQPVVFYATTMPQYPGGELAKKEFITTHLKALSSSKSTVLVIIDTVGAISKVEFPTGANFEDSKKITAMVRQMPTWIPGKNNEKLTCVRVVIRLSTAQ